MAIIHQSDATVQTNGKMRTGGFKMKASAKGFRIISTTLYRDPIRAIVRELICNAWDAQREAGNDTPIEVHLPTVLEPWFSVKDYGVGMSDDDIFGVYTTVFDSTKDHADDDIGGMGLGSKTPFSYNNGQSFIVTSIHKGIKGVYTAYLDAGEPAITCMVEPHKTDEPDGVEVKVPVVDKDYNDFTRAALTVIPFFQSPEISTNVEMEWDSIEYCDGYATQDAGYGTRIWALMGQVRYPVDIDLINKEMAKSLQSLVSGKNIYLIFDIGELDFQASREELHYDDVTIKKIDGRIAKIVKQIVSDSQQWLDDSDFPSIREAYIAARDRFSGTMLKHMTYNDGRSLYDWSNNLYKEPAVPLRGTISRIVPDASKATNVRRQNSTSSTWEIINSTTDYRKHPIIVVKDDLRTGGASITNEYVHQTKNKVYYMHPDKQTTCGIIRFLAERLESHEFVIKTTSQLKKEGYVPKRTSGSYSGSRSVTVQLYKLTQDGDFEGVKLTAHDLQTQKLTFVSLYYDILEIEPRSENGLRFDGISRAAIAWMMKVKNIDEVYIVRRSQLKYVEKNKAAKQLFKRNLTIGEVNRHLNIERSVISNEAHYYGELKTAWTQKQIQKFFGLGCSNKEFMDDKHHRLLGIYKDTLSQYNVKKNQIIEKFKSIQQDPKNELLFGLVDRSTPDRYVGALLDLMRKK